MRSILLLTLVGRCLETLDVCIWRMLVFMYVVVTVLGSVGMWHLSFIPLYCIIIYIYVSTWCITH